MAKQPRSTTVAADCEACGESGHETLAHQWLDGRRPRCGFCGEPLTRAGDVAVLFAADGDAGQEPA